MNQKILFMILALLLLGGIYYLASPKLEGPHPAACTQEAKLCPDGSAIGRTGPNCEFAACPNDDMDAWKTFTDPSQDLSFRYPEKLATIYLHPVDWPPEIRVNEGPFACIEAGSEVMPAGQTRKEVINGREYCVTRESEGAAGSIYTMYAYAFPLKDKVAIFTFSLRFVQCGNYPESQMNECNSERGMFDVSGVIDRMAMTLKEN